MPDFKAMLATPINFSGKTKAPEEIGVPAPLRRKQSAAVRLACLTEARQILGLLPGENESIHGLLLGRFDFSDVLSAAIDQIQAIDHLRLMSLSYNGRSITAIDQWLASGKVKRLTVVCSTFFYRHNGDLFERLAEALKERGPEHRLSHARSHAKLSLFDCADGRKVTFESSANLRSNSSAEQWACHCERGTGQEPGLHDFYAQWCDQQVASHAQSG